MSHNRCALLSVQNVVQMVLQCQTVWIHTRIPWVYSVEEWRFHRVDTTSSESPTLPVIVALIRRWTDSCELLVFLTAVVDIRICDSAMSEISPSHKFHGVQPPGHFATDSTVIRYHNYRSNHTDQLYHNTAKRPTTNVGPMDNLLHNLISFRQSSLVLWSMLASSRTPQRMSTTCTRQYSNIRSTSTNKKVRLKW